MTRIPVALALLAVVAVLGGCGSSSTAPSGNTNPTVTNYVGTVSSPAVTGSFKATITTPASGEVLGASAARAGSRLSGSQVGPLGGGGSSVTVTVTLLNGTMLTLTGTLNGGAFTVSDNASPPDMCTGNVASVLNATCSFLGISNIPLVGVLAVEGAAGTLVTYCGFETPSSTNTTAIASLFLGIAGTNSFLARVASSNNAQSFYLDRTATSTTIADTLIGSTGDIFAGTYTSTTASGTETAGGTAVGSWSATSPCTLIPATLTASTAAFTAGVNAASITSQAVTVRPSSVGPITAVVAYPAAPAPQGSPTGWLTAAVSDSMITLSVSSQTAATAAGAPLTATVNVYPQFAQSAPLPISVTYTVTSGPQPCAITTSPTLPPLTVGTVADVLLTTSGQCPTTGSDSWTVTGSLPAGLAIPLGGELPEIYGAPTMSGAYNGFTINLVNSVAGTAASETFNGGTVAVATVCEIGPVPEPPGIDSVLYAQGFVASDNCTSANDDPSLWSWGVTTGLPPGLTFDNPIVGVKDVGLTGTPTQPGTFTFTVTFTNANQVGGRNEASATQIYHMVINPPPSAARVRTTVSRAGSR